MMGPALLNSVAGVLVGVLACTSSAQPDWDKTGQNAQAHPCYRQRVIDLIESQQASPEGPNGWHELIGAIDELYLVVEPIGRTTRDGYIDFDTLPGGESEGTRMVDSGEGTLEETQRVRDRRAAALRALEALEQSGCYESLRRLEAADRVVPPVSERLLLIAERFHVGRCRFLARSLRARIATARDDRDWGRVVESSRFLLEIASALALEPNVVGRGVVQAIRAMAFREMHRTLGEPGVPTSVLRELVDCARQSQVTSIEFLIDGEEAAILDAIDWICCGDKIRTERLYSLAEIVPAIGVSVVGQRECRSDATNFFAALRIDAGRSYGERQGGILESDLVEADFAPSQLLVPVLLANWDQVFFQEARIEAMRASVIAAMGIELYRRERRRWPEHLQDIEPFTGEIPADPFSPDGHLRYVHAVADDAAVHVVLYSVGLDGRDDGGFGELWATSAFRVDGEAKDFVVVRSR